MSHIVERVKKARKNVEMAKDIMRESVEIMDSAKFMKNQDKEMSIGGVQKEFKGMVVENGN